ncbi:glutathione S-transferase D7-like [Culicoides brevitarsis]|uniref:glutathione S-transferase D7-like n=1 Tax=Culicoides brevitarsis TaxID=469753 RepID=UPI00307B42A4
MPNLGPFLTLYHDEFSLGSRIVLFVIRNLSLDVNIHPINVLNGHRDVTEVIAPTLIDHSRNNFRLTDYRAISSYLVECHRSGNSLFPNDIVKRAVINQRIYFDANTLRPRLDDIFEPILAGVAKEIPQQKKDRLKEALVYLNGFLELDKWVAGKDTTIADLIICGTVTAIRELGLRLDEHQCVQEWLEKCKQLLPGYDEMEVGAQNWAQNVKNRMT